MAVSRPMRQHAEHVAQVDLGVELVQSRLYSLAVSPLARQSATRFFQISCFFDMDPRSSGLRIPPQGWVFKAVTAHRRTDRWVLKPDTLA